LASPVVATLRHSPRRRAQAIGAIALVLLGLLAATLPGVHLLAQSRGEASAVRLAAALPGPVQPEQAAPAADGTATASATSDGATAASGTPESHTVQPGETLSEIAKSYGFSVEQLLRVNGIANANTIFVGQRLRLPQSDRPAGATVHVIVAGDTLSTIAREYGVSLEALMARNGINNANDITSGLELIIPDGTTPAPSEVAPTIALVSPTAESPTVVAPVVVAPAAQPEPAQLSEPTPATAAAPGTAPSTAPSKAPSTAPTAAPIATIAPVVILPSSVAGAPTTEPVRLLPQQGAVDLATPAAATAPAVESPAGPTAEQPAEDASAEDASASHTHTVKPGETASEIAKAYGVSLRDLLRANGIANADLLRSGAELIIPGAALDAVVATAEALQPDAAGSVDGSAASSAAATAVPMSMSATDAADSAASTGAGPAEIAHSVSAAAALPERPASSLNRTYTVRSGDTLGRIASRQGVDVEGLRILNGLPINAALRAGDELLLPATDDELLVRTPENLVVVRPGDSLSAIAVANGVDLGALMAANSISNADSIRAGQELVVPGRAIYGDAPLTRVGPARSGYYYYVVQAGDTLSELADNLNTTKTALMDYNNLTDESTLFTGMELRIPYGAPDLPTRTPPVPISGTSFLISLSRQQCWVLNGTEVRNAWNCSTGRADRRTKTGSFKVQSKIANAESNIWRLDMPYWLGIYDVGRVENGIHGLPVDWDTGRKIWTRLIGQPATFGCAMLDDTNAETLWNMAYLGMPVTIVQ
jgi:LysM repeat protein